jgi:hypothetical protein
MEQYMWTGEGFLLDYTLRNSFEEYQHVPPTNVTHGKQGLVPIANKCDLKFESIVQ